MTTARSARLDGTTDRLLRARIAGQSGLLTRTQALRAGLSPAAIRWQVSSGRWVQVHRSVYLTTPGRDDWTMRVVAALLAIGTPCALCGPSAGTAWGLTPEVEGDVQVLVPLGRCGMDRPGITVVRSRRFDDRVHPEAWPPRTTAEHTVFDLAAGHPFDRVVALMAKACQLRIATEASLAQALRTRPLQTHRQLVAEALGIVGEGAESAAEVRFIRDVERAHGLPLGVSQEPAPGQRFRDRAYAAYRLIVEIDGRLGHSGWAGRQKDGRRDRKAARGGLLTVRGSWPDVAGEPCELADDLGQIFRERGWPGQARPCSHGCALADPAA
ncbi:MAG: type IV toxin-antitoxin system AbiEi family antitoxin domain-containing protein [Intrasporangium sp.]|uniref:type IV toxin-antitoxin system AbiEi family antitoxin domain-containing protein n=1 Tax=Intrasporangium sp. TaxID=1925024 RepID=UPI002648A49C|nr:type IV toxin-antitoxin system AbiEi family antitoxin domain-containing protein [Intrasporangium sp.]MDN5795436.1 type IV toxin-antitoxin system AbiEi family antitoxin domain-containing protein [Intrasporangium sp.]